MMFFFLLAGMVTRSTGLPFPFATFSPYVTALFLLIAGLESYFEFRGKLLRTVLLITLAAVSVPFAAGYLLSPILGIEAEAARWVFSVALSVSALPVIIQILREQKIFHSEMGRIILSVATLSDLLAWLLFWWILPSKDGTHWLKSHVLLLFFFLGFGIRVSGQLPKRIGILIEKLGRWTVTPTFFFLIGLQINLRQSFDFPLILAITFIAMSTKFLAVYVGGIFLKCSQAWSATVGLVLCARGAMEILLAQMAFSLGLISEKLFVSLVIMAILTSVLVSPILWSVKNGNLLWTKIKYLSGKKIAIKGD